MSAMTFAKTGGFAGLAAVALMVMGGVLGNLGGMPPTPGAPAAHVASFYRVNQDSTLFSAIANAFAGVLLLVLAGGLRVSFSRADREEGWARVGLVGAGMFSAMLFAVSAIQFALPATASDPSAVLALSNLWNAGVATLGVAMVPLLVGFGVSALQSQRWPAWIGWIAFAGAATGSIGWIAAALSGTVAQLASLIGALQYPALFLWLVASSLALVRSAP